MNENWETIYYTNGEKLIVFEWVNFKITHLSRYPGTLSKIFTIFIWLLRIHYFPKFSNHYYFFFFVRTLFAEQWVIIIIYLLVLFIDTIYSIFRVYKIINFKSMFFIGMFHLLGETITIFFSITINQIFL